MYICVVVPSSRHLCLKNPYRIRVFVAVERIGTPNAIRHEARQLESSGEGNLLHVGLWWWLLNKQHRFFEGSGDIQIDLVSG